MNISHHVNERDLVMCTWCASQRQPYNRKATVRKNLHIKKKILWKKVAWKHSKIHSQYKLRDIRTLCASADGTIGWMKAVAQNAKKKKIWLCSLSPRYWRGVRAIDWKIYETFPIYSILNINQSIWRINHHNFLLYKNYDFFLFSKVSLFEDFFCWVSKWFGFKETDLWSHHVLFFNLIHKNTRKFNLPLAFVEGIHNCVH